MQRTKLNFSLKEQKSSHTADIPFNFPVIIRFTGCIHNKLLVIFLIYCLANTSGHPRGIRFAIIDDEENHQNIHIKEAEFYKLFPIIFLSSQQTLVVSPHEIFYTVS